MDTQVYLLLARKAGDFNMASGALWAKQVLKDMILGDSLDTPFLKFIRVQSVSHSIGFPGRQSVAELANPGDDHLTEYETTGENETAGDYEQWGAPQRHDQGPIFVERKYNRWGTYKSRGIAGGWGETVADDDYEADFFSRFRNNQFINPALPEHGSLSFTKWPDNSTPQLAYGCSSQEPMAFGAFFFRRRIGAGIMGVRLPFMMIGLSKCLITGWEMGDGLTEKVTLSYKDIIWSTYDQLADINVPTGMSTRIWKTDTKEGGESKDAYKLQALIAILTVAIGGAVALTGAGDGVKKG